MPKLTWSVYTSKDFVETKRVTRDLCPPNTESSQQDREMSYGLGQSRLVKDNGDYSSELGPEASPEN